MDKGFATRYYSMLFKIAGLEEVFYDNDGNLIDRKQMNILKDKGELFKREVIDDLDSYSFEVFSKKERKSIRDGIRLVTEHYKDGYIIDFEHPDKKIKVSSKIHSKTYSTKNTFYIGSFNFSENATTNREQLMAFINHPIVEKSKESFEGLYKMSDISLEQRTDFRNAMWERNYRIDCNKLFMAK